MSILGSLADLSLPEILQFIHKGNRTGLLTLRILSEFRAMPPSVHYLWVYEGRLVAAANRLDAQGLVTLIHQCQWVNNRLVTKLAQVCPKNKPLGLHLKNRGVLTPEQLKQLFNLQVLHPVGMLSQLKDGFFQFDQNALMPPQEMTGLSISAGSPKLFAPVNDAKALRRQVAQSPSVKRSRAGSSSKTSRLSVLS